jgi:sn-glycerol 3-phosphate transport system substrate-binding protein
MVILERAAGVPVLSTQNLLLDMTPYVKRDSFNMNNFPKVLLGFSYYKGQLVSLPFIRSTPVFYYNKGLFAKAGYHKAPKTVNELVTMGKKIAVIKNGQTEVYGFEMLNDPAWYVQNFVYQLGSNILSKDGLTAPCLADGKLLKVLTAWRQWVDSGWCAAPTVTNWETNMKDLFNQGKIASFIMSSGGMTSILKTGKVAGIDVGVAFLPTMGKPAAPTGGGNLAIIKKNTTPQQQAAAWEFMKFLMSDEQVALNAASTGYLPATISSTKTEVIQKLWRENPQYKVAFDQLAIAQELPWSPYKSEFEEVMTTTCSNLIMDRSITPKQAVENLKREASVIFPRKKK